MHGQASGGNLLPKQSKPGCWGSEGRNPGHITLFGDTCLWDVLSACHQNIDSPTPRPSHRYRKLGQLQGLSTGLSLQLGLIQVLETLWYCPSISSLFHYFQGTKPLAPKSFSEGSSKLLKNERGKTPLHKEELNYKLKSEPSGSMARYGRLQLWTYPPSSCPSSAKQDCELTTNPVSLGSLAVFEQ